MKKILNWRLSSLFIWIIIAAIAVISMPDLSQLVREKGQIELPEDAQVLVANEYLQEMNSEDSDVYDLIIVFYSGNEDSFTTEQRDEMESIIEKLEEQKDSLKITSITSPLDGEEVAEQLVSENDSAALDSFPLVSH